MALPDPIPTITVNSVTYDLPRVSFGVGTSEYRTSNGLDKLTISHSEKNRQRHVVRFDRKKIAATPFDAAKDQEYRAAVYTVIDAPILGFTPAELDYLVQLQAAFWVAGTPDYGLRVLQGEV